MTPGISFLAADTCLQGWGGAFLRGQQKAFRQLPGQAHTPSLNGSEVV